MSILTRFAGFGRRRKETEDSALAEQTTVDVERADPEELRAPIVAALRTVFDPEIPVNIYDLGLIYRIGIATSGDLEIDMTLTAPACPVAGAMPRMVEDAVRKVDGVGKIRVELVWEPPWTQAKMSDEALLQLGMM